MHQDEPGHAAVAHAVSSRGSMPTSARERGAELSGAINVVSPGGWDRCSRMRALVADTLGADALSMHNQQTPLEP